MDLIGLSNIIKTVLNGASASLLIFVCTLILSLPLGLFVAIARMSKFKPLSLATEFIISVLRGTPLMLQLICWFFAPYYIFKIRLNTAWRIISILIGFSVNYAAYFAEIYRSGIQSISIGQYEAANVLGYSKYQTFVKIILPQMIKNVIPSVTNEIISLTKDTSLAFAVAYAEMFTLAKQVAAAKTSVLPLFVAGAVYYIFNLIVAWVMDIIESKLNYYK